MKAEDANKIAEAYTKGGEEAAKKMAESLSEGAKLDMNLSAIDGAGILSGTMAGAKTASDLKAVDAHGGSEQYISDKSGSTYSKEITEATAAQSFDKPDMMNKKAGIIIESRRSAMGDAAAEKITASMVEQGILEEGSTSKDFTATTGDKARKAYAQSKAGAMESDEKLMIDDSKVNVSQNLTSGKGVATFDSANTSVTGTQHTSKVTDAATKNLQDSAEANGLSPDEIKQQMEQTKANVNVANKLETGLAATVINGRVGKDGIVASEENGGTKDSSFLAEHIDEMAIATGATMLGATGLAGLNKYSKIVQPEKIAMSEKDMTSRGFTPNENGDMVGKNGNIVTQKDGKFYDESGDVMKKDNPKYQNGIVKRGYDASVSKTGDLLSSVSPFTKTKEPLDGSTDSTNQNQNGKSNDSGQDSPNNKVHNDSSKDNIEGKSPSKDSISKTPKSRKSTYNPAKLIEAQGKVELWNEW